jgi:hypothetical protein
MARRRRRASAARKSLIFILLVACLIALILYLKNGGTGSSGDSTAQVEINEVMISNKGAVPDETGDFPDWVEIYNSTDSALDISATVYRTIFCPRRNGRSRTGPSSRRTATLSCFAAGT